MVKHPCVNKCNSNLSSEGVCSGCGRNVSDVLHWPGYSDEEKQLILRVFKHRVASRNRERNIYDRAQR